MLSASALLGTACLGIAIVAASPETGRGGQQPPTPVFNGSQATAGATVVGARKFLVAFNINLNTPDVTTTKGLRDRAILAVLLGCGLRRSEVAALTVGHVQQRDSTVDFIFRYLYNGVVNCQLTLDKKLPI
jgi:hypothetical protein